MEIRVKAEDLQSLVGKLKPVVSDTIVLDLKNGQMYGFDSWLTVVVTDPKLKAPDAEDLDGPVAVSSKQFVALVQRAKGEVGLSIVGSRVLGHYKRVKFDLPSSYPTRRPDAPPPVNYKLPLQELASAVAFASSGADPKEHYKVTGIVRLTAINNFLRAIALDGKHMTVADMPFMHEDFSINCPAMLAGAIKYLEGDIVEVSENKNVICLVTPQVTIIGLKLASEQPPNVDSYFPTNPTFEAEVAADAMAEALKNVSPTLAFNEVYEVSPVRLAFSNDSVHLSTTDGKAKAEDWIDCSSLNSFETTIDHRCLREFFNLVKGMAVKITGTNGIKPILFTAGNYKLLVAPKVTA